MTRVKHLLVAASIVLLAAVLTAQGQGLDPSAILKPLSESWPTYSGDYSGKRYSSLTEINQSNVKSLALAWVARVTAGPGAGAPTGSAAGAAPTIIGGEGTGEIVASGGAIRGAVLAVH